MTFQKIIALPVIALSVGISTGCSAKSNQKTYTTVKSSGTVEHQHGQPTKTSPSSRYLKPGASINYSYNLPTDMTPGQSVTFQLTLDEAYNTGIMTVDIRSNGDIQVFPTSTRGIFDMSSGNTHTMDVSITVGSLGLHYLNIQAIADNGQGQAMPRIFSIPVQSGSSKTIKPHSKMMKTPGGENIIMMEAEEEIIQ